MPHPASPDPSPAPDGPSPAPDGGKDAPGEKADREEDDWWDHCPLCGARLRNQGCKYRCPRCRYFMSCSDFD